MFRTTAVLILGACACSVPARRGRDVIRVVGSDTMINLSQAWAERYAKVHPDVSVRVAGGGSGVGIAGLIDGTLDIAAASREMRPAEHARVRERFGTVADQFTVALDALAIFVHRDNPLRAISVAQIAEIYGDRGAIVKWSQLGITNRACASGKIIRVGRQNNSGTYSYFRDKMLGATREYKLGSIDQSGSKDVVALVSRTPCAIGYSGLAFANEGVRALALAMRPGARAVEPSERTVLDKSYPLARPLYLYSVGGRPRHVDAFLDWVRDPDGQQIVRELGLVPFLRDE